MSGTTERADPSHPDHGAPASHDDHHAQGEGGHGTMRSYMTGFGLSVVLTAIPFWLVMAEVISNAATVGIVIMALAAVQIVVHMIYFLHMNTKSEGGWNMLALIFTLVLVIITLSGSLWVMYHLNTNMMPMTHQEMNNMP